MPSSIKVLAEYSSSDLRGWFSNAASGEASSASADRENWSLVDQFENRIDHLSSINDYEGNIFDQINARANKGGFMRGGDHLAFQEQSSILNVRRNNPDDIAQSNGIRATGSDKEWTHLAIDFPQNLSDEQKVTYRECVIRGLNQPHFDVKISGKNPVMTGEGHIALLASDPHTTQGHEDHFHSFVHCHAYDANGKEISKRIDWSVAEVRRQAVGAINRELEKAGFIKEVDPRGFSTDPNSCIDFSTSTHSLANSTVAQKQLLQQAGITPQVPARTVTGQPVAPAAPAITDPEASKIRDGIEKLEVHMGQLLAQFEMNKALHESLTHGANAAEQLTQAREERNTAVKDAVEMKETLKTVQGRLTETAQQVTDVTEILVKELDPELTEGQEITLKFIADIMVTTLNDTQSALETEEAAHSQTKEDLTVVKTMLEETEDQLVVMAKNLSEANVTLTTKSQELTEAKETITERDAEIAQLTERLDKLEAKYNANVGETTRIQSELEKVTGEKTMLENQFNEVVEKLDAAQETVRTIENIVARAAANNGLEYTTTEETVKSLSEALKDQKVEVVKLNELVESKQAEILQKEIQIEGLIKDLGTANSNVTEMKELTVKQSAQLEKQSDTINSMMEKFSSMMDKTQELQNTNSSLQGQLASVIENNKQLTGRLAEIGEIGELDRAIQQDQKMGNVPPVASEVKPAASGEFDEGATVTKPGGVTPESMKEDWKQMGEKLNIQPPKDDEPKQK